MTAWLLTWLWQGVALVGALWLVLRFLPRVNAATRYLLWWGAFAALIALGYGTLPAGRASGADVPGLMQGVSTEPWLAVRVQPLPAWALSLILMAWGCVACFRLLRIFPGLHALYRLKDECRPFPAELNAQLTLWQESRGRRVRLALCDGVPGASVLGFHDPCIAVPASLLDELQPEELNQIILHEYGHVQRRDDWMRLLQTLLEAAIWLHPAVWLIGRALNLEREVACDDWVIGRTGSPRNYARCLSRVAQRRRAPAAPAFAQAFFGVRRHLLTRVDRLLDGRRNARRAPSIPAAVLGGAAIAVCAIQLRSFPAISEAPAVSASLVVSAPVASGVSQTVIPPVADRIGVEPATNDETVRLPPTPRLRRSTEAVRSVRLQADLRLHADLPADPVDLSASSAEVRSSPEPAPVLYPTRVFAGRYERAENSPPVKKENNGSFDGVVAAGLGIGEAAQKAGLGLSGAFTRAGTGLARRF